MFTSEDIVNFQTVPTPFYYYDLSLLRQTLEAAVKASRKYGYHIHYALKANVDDRVLETIRDYGFGADCVSGNEVKKAIDTGFDKSKVVFAGVGKSDAEINLALDAGIFCFNVESSAELEVLDELAGKQNYKAKIALRLNPNVNANTHHYITTGLEENKFGINQWELGEVTARLKQLKNVEFIGLHFHIGSQIPDLSVFKNLCTRVNDLQAWFLDHGFKLPHLNLGGGLGVNYHQPEEYPIPDFDAYFKVFDDFLVRLPGQQVHFELGRAFVAQCGSLVSRVLYVKKGLKTNFVILDAGMTDLIRPMLYEAYHKIENCSAVNTKNSPILRYDVVGPVCESSDCLGKAVELPETKRGDVMVIRTTGAYGEVMASNYNLRDKAKVYYSS